ncbi:DUF2507 domain-containing protein [Fuchsiella alkaliacetigena]|uniref:DUF2507 domain-containing protein n=1 Tax=Fuchsiella alkaliacetigena TaxID=957042 RepID=UPI00200A90E6|nr:DUF2507 domain-containing protein [Fuchsiella alkaliacetigena]MCK8825420.1 DUF2507 domain-containing protein [Fuchsiella alkaliacetigena]
MKLKAEEIISSQRDELGDSVPLTTFRLLRILGMEEIFADSSGPALYMVGKSVANQLPIENVADFLGLIESMRIGKAEIIDKSEQQVIIRVYECMTCSGLPDIGELICDFEAGLIAGGLEVILDTAVKTTQTHSWTAGDKFCQFETNIF